MPREWTPPPFRIARRALPPLLAVLAAPLPAAAQTGGRTPLRVERLLTLGGDSASSGAEFVDVADVAAAPSGELYVLDAGDRAVKVYTPAGRFVRRFGRQGGGPGEFALPVSLRVDSLVRVSDLGQRRMSYFALDGRHVRTVPSPVFGETALLGLAPLRNGWAVGATPTRMGVAADGTLTGSAWVAVIAARAGGGADTLLRLHSGNSAVYPRDGNGPYGPFGSHVGRGGAHAVLGDSMVAVADGYSGAVRWYRADRGGLALVRTRRLESRSRPVTRDDVRRIERELYAQNPDFPRGLVIEPPPRVSIATQALFATDGSLWIRNTDGRGHAHVWTVFDAAGEVSLRLSLPAGFELHHVRGDRLYGVARTASDAPVVQVYRLVRG
jgi:hypothetical protein